MNIQSIVKVVIGMMLLAFVCHVAAQVPEGHRRINAKVMEIR